MSKVAEKMTWVEAIMYAIQEKDAMAPRPGDKDQFGNDLYMGESSDAEACFDTDLDRGQFPTIHWIIAKWMLRDASEYVMVDKLQTYMGMVKRNIEPAINRLIDGGVKVYKIIENGGEGRNISCITLRPWYKNASEANGNRIEKRLLAAVANGFSSAETMCPEKLAGFAQKVADTAELSRRSVRARMIGNGEQGEAAGNFNAPPAGYETTQSHRAGNM